jgi:type VI secretion system protein ImpF
LRLLFSVDTRLVTQQRYRRSLLDRLITDPATESRGIVLSYTVDQLRDAVARDVEALLNSRASVDFSAMEGLPHVQRSIVCFGIRDFVGKVLSNSEDQRFIASCLSQAIESFEKRLRNVRITIHERAGSTGSLSFTIHAMLQAHPSAEPVAFDAVMQPSLSRFAVRPSRG